MKTTPTQLPKCLLLSLCLWLGPGNPDASAQAIKPEVLYSFKVADGSGGNPLCLGPDGAFYGATFQGGDGLGTIFKVTTNGVYSTLAVLHGTNGVYPQAGLTLGPDGFFYGVASNGGTNGGPGTVFKVSTNGALTAFKAFTSTYNSGSAYTNADGAAPVAGLALGTDGALYGTTTQGGTGGYGTVFRVTTNGTFTALASFQGTNGSGAYGVLIQGLDGGFYGTTYNGGVADYGVVFRVGTNGVITRLVAFDFANGYGPFAGLTPAGDGSFFGTTGYAATGNGSVFQVTTNGGFTSLAVFDWGHYDGSKFINLLGVTPSAPLVAGADGNYYGTAGGGGIYGYGTVFQLTPAGLITAVANFDQTNGWGPRGLVVGGDGNFYGTTSSGGANGHGVFYRLPGPPAITSQPASQIGFTGQSVTFRVTTTGGSPFSYQWYFKGSPVANATNSTLTVPLPNTYSPLGLYFVVATNPLGSVTSQPASLTVLDPPVIINPGMSNGVAQFGVVFSSGSVLAVVEASTNLVNWTPLQTLTLNRFEVPFADPQSPLFQQRFYRVRALP